MPVKKSKTKAKAAGTKKPAARRVLPTGRTAQEVIAILEARIASGSAVKADHLYLEQLRKEAP